MVFKLPVGLLGWFSSLSIVKSNSSFKEVIPLKVNYKWRDYQCILLSNLSKSRSIIQNLDLDLTDFRSIISTTSLYWKKFSKHELRSS